MCKGESKYKTFVQFLVDFSGHVISQECINYANQQWPTDSRLQPELFKGFNMDHLDLFSIKVKSEIIIATIFIYKFLIRYAMLKVKTQDVSQNMKRKI